MLFWLLFTPSSLTFKPVYITLHSAGLQRWSNEAIHVSTRHGVWEEEELLEQGRQQEVRLIFRALSPALTRSQGTFLLRTPQFDVGCLMCVVLQKYMDMLPRSINVISLEVALVVVVVVVVVITRRTQQGEHGAVTLSCRKLPLWLYEWFWLQDLINSKMGNLYYRKYSQSKRCHWLNN